MSAEVFRTFADFIKKMDVSEKETLAVVCNIGLDTTYVWASRNAIPREKWPDLMTHYPALTLEKLYAMEIASKSEG